MRLAFTLRVALSAVVVLVLTFGCGGNDEDSLNGTEWTLVSGVQAPSHAVPTLVFDREIAGGFSGCNQYEAEWEVGGDSIEFGEWSGTDMGCPDPEMETEMAYYSVFATVDGWAIEDSELILYSDGDEVLRYAAVTD